MRRFPFLLLACLTAPLAAATLEPVGVLGNSGVAGPALIRAVPGPNESLLSGVYLDADQCLWLSAGDGVNQVSLAGELIRHYPLEPAGTRFCSLDFAAAGGKLFFLGFLPQRDPKTQAQTALFALSLQGGRAAEVVLLLPEVAAIPVGLAQEPVNGELVLAFATDQGGKRQIAVESVNPDTYARRRLFALPGESVNGLAVDPDGQHLYLGGYFGRFVGASIHHPYASDIVKLTLEGQEVWRSVCLDPGPEPVHFRGFISYAAGAIWDGAWYGFLGRMDTQGSMAPGKVGSWLMQAPQPTQVLDVRGALGARLLPATGPAAGQDPLLISSRLPHQVYLAAWDTTTQRLALLRRYGSLPNVYSVGLSADGWVAVGMDLTTYWWRFDDAPWAPPAAGNYEGGLITQGGFRENEFCFLLRFDQEKSIPCVARPANGRGSAARFFDDSPWRVARAFAVGPVPGHPDQQAAYATAEDGSLWRTLMYPTEWRPDSGRWVQLTLAGNAPAHAGELAVLGDGRLALADGNAVILYAVEGQAATPAARLEAWGAGPEAHFGDELHLAADGGRLLVADTKRDRLLLFDTADLTKPPAVFGVTDTPGDDLGHLKTPGPVSLCGDRAVVADVGNQRVVKLVTR